MECRSLEVLVGGPGRMLGWALVKWTDCWRDCKGCVWERRWTYHRMLQSSTESTIDPPWRFRKRLKPLLGWMEELLRATRGLGPS